MRDDLVQQLAEVISDAIAAGAGESHSPVNAVARAVLASGLVVPAAWLPEARYEAQSDYALANADTILQLRDDRDRLRRAVLDLAQQWGDAVPDLTATRGPDRGRTLAACADELRALTQQESQ